MSEFKELFHSVKKFFAKGRRKEDRAQSIIVTVIWLCFFAYSLTLVFVYFWVLMSSFKNSVEFGLTPFAFPKFPTFENYTKAFISLNVSFFKNGNLEVAYIEHLLGNTFL